MALTSADLPTLQARLAEAEGAYHALMLGQNVVEIRHMEREMRFSQADASKLSAYIAQLNGQIATLQAGGTLSGRRGRSRQIYF